MRKVYNLKADKRMNNAQSGSFQVLKTVLLSLVVLLLPSVKGLAQEKRISGTVISSDDRQPLPGVSVQIKGTSKGTTTDANGVFVINASPGQVLRFNSIGFTPQEITVGASNTINITLVSSATQLNDVVVIGYGTASRANLTTAQTSISTQDINRTVNTTVEQAIQGRAAGVYITQNSGQPGGGISVNIRGINSINGNTEPLYVIDGVQIQGGGETNSSNPLAGLNPSDIDDIQILQGPSATAIYGSRATNGVILITTKRGKSGETAITFGSQYSVQTPPKHLSVMNLRQYAQMENDYKAIAGGTVPDQLLDPSILGAGTDWQNELFKNAGMQKYQLSLSGGSNTTTYYLSGDYLKQDGVAEGSGFDRYSFRLNLDNKPRKWISLGANLSFNQTNESLTTSSEGIISSALQLSPEIPVKNLNGTWAGGDVSNPAHQFSPVNPIAISSLVTNENVRRQFLGGLNLGIDITKGLTFKTSLNTNVGYASTTYYMPVYSIGWAINSTASLTNGNNQSTYWNWNQLLEYHRQFGKHNVGLMVSHEAQESKWKNVNAARTGFLTDNVLDLNAGDPNSATNTGGSGPWAMESYLGRVNYNYDNRYILTGTIRRDGSANFGAENRWGTFPSLSAAWRVSQEDFFKVPVISELKLRLETGVTGNSGGSPYSSLSSAATAWGSGFLPSEYPNPKLQWEETKTDNIGIGIGLIKNRISIDADYYIKHTDNLLMPAALPAYMGTNGIGQISAPMVNAGSLKTNGWSVTLNTTNISTKNFTWQSNLNLSHFKSIIKSLNTDKAFFERTSWWLNNWTQRSAIGAAPWLFRGYIEEGIFTSIDEINNSAIPVDNNGNRLPIEDIPNGVYGVYVGDVKFKDINDDGKIDVNDMTNIGNPWPKFFGGFTNSFSYKGFDLSILITGAYGNDVYNYIAAANSNPNNINLGRNLLTDAINFARITTDDNGNPVLSNPGTTVPRIFSGPGPNGNYARNTSKWVEDGSYLRLKNISLSYQLPASLLSRQKIIKSVNATLSAQNVFTITGYSGFDPEVGSYVGANANTGNQAIGLDNGRYPLTPIYTFSLGVNF